VFDPDLEDQKNRALDGCDPLLIIGGALSVAGFACFGWGQARIPIYHKKHRATLAPLSGYEQVVK